MAEIIEQVDIREENLDLTTGYNSVTVTAVSDKYGLSESGHSKEVSINTGSLAYEPSSDGTYFIVTGIGESTSKYITIPPEVPDENSQYKPVKEIASGAFAQKDIMGVEIPGSITNIGYRAFYGCPNLTDVTIKEGVTSIGSNAFAMCSALTSVELPDSLTSIGMAAFSGCVALERNIAFGINVTSIGDDAFKGCSQLKKVIFWSGGERLNIGSGAFQNTGLESVFIPKSAEVLGANAFKGCVDLTSVTFGDNGLLTEIGASAFSGCTSLTKVEIPEGVVNIREFAFDGCSAIEGVKLANSVKEISRFAFRGCASLTELRWGADNMTADRNKAKLEKIGNNAFQDCTSLLWVNIPASVTRIEPDAFMGCSPERPEAFLVSFDDKYTWFVSTQPTEDVSKATLVPVEDIDAGVGISFITEWQTYYWFKLKQMPAPTLEYNPSTFILTMKDSSGLADSFKIYVKVNGVRTYKATVAVT